MSALFAGDARPRENALTTADRNALVLGCDRLCQGLARKAAAAAPGVVDAEDLEQEAFVACTEAAARFDPAAGVRFSTYATTCVGRHLGQVVTRARGQADVHLETWDGVAGRGPDADDAGPDPWEPTPDQAEALRRLPEPTRTAVGYVLAGDPPDRVAVRLGVGTKDVKLMLRNAAPILRRDLSRLARPSLFGAPDDEADDDAA